MLNRLLTCALFVVSLAGCGQRDVARTKGAKETKGATSDLEKRVVRVVTATEKETERTLFANGTLAARDQAGLSVKVAGRLEEIPVDIGSVVKRGATIAQIQRRDYELKVEQAKAAVAAARARLGLPLDGTDDSIEVNDSRVGKEKRAPIKQKEKKPA